MTQAMECQHDGEMKTGWDELTCKKCGWILPSGQRIGIHFGWFPSHEAHKEFKKYRTYTGMNEVYPIDATKYAEAQNMTQNNEREAFEKPLHWDEFEKWWKKHGQYCRAGGGEYEKSFAWAAFEYLKSQSPISQNEQQPKQIPEGWITNALVEALNCDYQSTLDSEQVKIFNTGVATLYEIIKESQSKTLTSETNTEVRE